jgi:hypothetical protein
MVADIFKEAHSWPCLSDDASDVWPEMSRIVGAALFSGHAEWLARVAANDAIHEATPRSAVEGSEIRPKRRLVQSSRLHLPSQDFAGVGFDLHSTDDASSWDRQLDAVVESAASGAEAKHVDGT